MFNSFTYEKKLKEKQQLDIQKQKFLQENEQKKIRNAKLAEAYKKRVENFVINMLEKPTVLNKYQGPKDVKFREDQPDKFKGDPQIYVKGFKREKDRIQMALDKHKNLLFEPAISVQNYDYRPRQMDREIQPELRFSSYKTSLEKLQAFVQNNFMNEIENDDFRKVQKQKKQTDLENSIPKTLTKQEKQALMAKEIARNVMPSLHNKTHFKAASDLFNQNPVCISNQSATSFLQSQKKLSQTYSTPQIQKQKIHANKRASQKQLSNVSNILGELEENSNTGTPKRAPNKSKTLFAIGDNQQLIQDSVKQTHNTVIQNTGQMTLQRNTQDKKLDKKDQQNNTTNNDDGFNASQSSKHILELCGYNKPKNQKIKPLIAGEGHLISNADLSISQVYQQLSQSRLNVKQFKNPNSSSYMMSTRSQTNIYQ